MPSAPSTFAWQPYLVAQLIGSVEVFPQHDLTRQAEQGLVIETSFYWYVLSGHSSFAGSAIGVWHVSGELTGLGGGCCPFDTGGLWHERFTVEPPLETSDERRTYFRQNDVPLELWGQEVLQAIKRSYSDIRQYVAGAAPGTPMTLRDHSSNTDPRAWLWEARTARSNIGRHRLRPDHFYWTPEDEESFFRWLRRDITLTRTEVGDLTDNVLAQGRVVDDLLSAVRQELNDRAPTL